MTTCESVRDSLGAWLDGELNAVDAGSIQLHVDHCAACSRERQQLHQLDTLLTSALGTGAAEIAGGPFWRAVEQRIAQRRTWYSEVTDWLGATLRPPRLAWGVPVVIGLLLGLLSLESVVPVWRQEAQRKNFASVESIDAHGLNVTLFRDNETKTTVIWLYQNPEGEDESSGKVTETGHSF